MYILCKMCLYIICNALRHGNIKVLNVLLYTICHFFNWRNFLYYFSKWYYIDKQNCDTRKHVGPRDTIIIFLLITKILILAA